MKTKHQKSKVSRSKLNLFRVKIIIFEMKTLFLQTFIEPKASGIDI